jgi:hypothetical protein
MIVLEGLLRLAGTSHSRLAFAVTTSAWTLR